MKEEKREGEEGREIRREAIIINSLLEGEKYYSIIIQSYNYYIFPTIFILSLYITLLSTNLDGELLGLEVGWRLGWLDGTANGC